MDVFLEREEAASISVDRMDHASTEELATLSMERAQNRTPPRNFYGWAVVTAANAGKNGRTVAATPTLENRCHADILLNVAGERRRQQQKQHAIELAAHAQWLEPEPLTYQP